MMKKTYIKPETITVKVELQQMIAGTTPNTQIDPDQEAEKDPTTGDYGDARAFGFFFEESEEEF